MTGAGHDTEQQREQRQEPARQVTDGGRNTEQQRERRQEPARPQGPRNRLHRPWQEAQAAQVPRQGRTGMRTQPPRQAKATYAAVVQSRKETDDPADRHRLRDPVVGAWGDPNRRTADRGTRWVTRQEDTAGGRGQRARGGGRARGGKRQNQ